VPAKRTFETASSGATRNGRVAFRKKVYRSTDELQADLDAWIKEYKRASQHPSVYVIEENRLC
jgi:hypothetical protein